MYVYLNFLMQGCKGDHQQNNCSKDNEVKITETKRQRV